MGLSLHLLKVKDTKAAPDQTAQYWPQGKTLQPKTGSLFNLRPHFYDSTSCGKANWNNGKELLEDMFAITAKLYLFARIFRI